jgi:hypothetical protein
MTTWLKNSTAILFAIIFLAINIGCSEKILPVNRITLKNQDHGFILGTSELNILIDSVKYYPLSRTYEVKGYIDDVNHNGNDSVKFNMWLLRNGDSTFYDKTGVQGKFKVYLKKKDTIMFYGEQDKFLYVR